MGAEERGAGLAMSDHLWRILIVLAAAGLIAIELWSAFDSGAL